MIWFVPLNECFNNLDVSKYYNICITFDYIIMKRQDVIKPAASAVAVGENGIFQPLPWRRVVTLCEWVGRVARGVSQSPYAGQSEMQVGHAIVYS